MDGSITAETLVRLDVVLVVLLPLLAFATIGAPMLAGRALSERAIARIATGALTLSLLFGVALSGRWIALGGGALDLRLGAWFGVEDHHFELGVLIDALSIVMLVVSNVITVLVARFSIRYLHREVGFARFFLLVCLFAAGMDVLVLAGSYDLLFAGWELVGLSSILLVAFYHHRAAPTRGAIRVMLTYRIADVGLLVAGVLLHHFTGSSDFAEAFGGSAWPGAATHLSTAGATIVALALLLSTLGKSAQFPLGGWLPRAMEGPTPSSALFYGALSVHAGVYLLLRSAPLLEASPIASVAVGTIGAITAIQATMIGRTQTDAKSMLAYATMTQVGLMLVAIGLHLWVWTLVHMVAHVALRLFQLLRAPSALRDAQEIRSALAAAPRKRPSAWVHLLPERALAWLYHLARHRFLLDELLERAVVQPALRGSRALDGLERRLVAGLSGWGADAPREVQPTADTAHAEKGRS